LLNQRVHVDVGPFDAEKLDDDGLRILHLDPAVLEGFDPHDGFPGRGLGIFTERNIRDPTVVCGRYDEGDRIYDILICDRVGGWD
jgi:hypothetical protein